MKAKEIDMDYYVQNDRMFIQKCGEENQELLNIYQTLKRRREKLIKSISWYIKIEGKNLPVVKINGILKPTFEFK